MPSTLVHVALAGLIGTALLADEFDARAVALVMGAAALPDVDSAVDLWVAGLHRALFHNLVLPAVVLLALWWDVRVREESYVRRRWGARGIRLAWVTALAVVFAHVLLDAFFNGANLLWPLHDRFYDLSGHLRLSDQRGIVQTFVEVERGADGTTTVSNATARGTTNDTAYSYYYADGDPSRGGDPEPVERTVPLADTGERFVLTVAGFAVVGIRLLEQRRE